MAEGEGYGLRRRKRAAPSEGSSSLAELLQLVDSCEKIVVFTGSGLSANSGAGRRLEGATGRVDGSAKRGARCAAALRPQQARGPRRL